MRWSFDSDGDALYVYFGESESPVRQRELDEGIVADLAEDGRVVGVEVLSVGAGWSAEAVLHQIELDPDDAAALRGVYYATLLLVMEGTRKRRPRLASETVEIPVEPVAAA